MNTQHVSRRQFINTPLTTAAVAGATWFDIPEILAASGKKAALNKYGGFPMGIQSYSLRGFGVDGAIEQTHKLGLHFIDLYFVLRDREVTAETLDKVQTKLVGLLDCAVHSESPQGVALDAHREATVLIERGLLPAGSEDFGDIKPRCAGGCGCRQCGVDELSSGNVLRVHINSIVEKG